MILVFWAKLIELDVDVGCPKEVACVDVDGSSYRPAYDHYDCSLSEGKVCDDVASLSCLDGQTPASKKI